VRQRSPQQHTERIVPGLLVRGHHVERDQRERGDHHQPRRHHREQQNLRAHTARHQIIESISNPMPEPMHGGGG
jgi:hypothetical protein